MSKLNSIGDPYKFKSLKVYASNEWLYEGKNYRTVFEASETTFLYAELCVYNKLFDEEAWKTKASLKCYNKTSRGKGKEICDLDADLTVDKDQNEVFVREGWGNKAPGVFWKKGDYIWEAYIGDTLVGECIFHVEDAGSVTETENPYFTLDSVKAFEGGWEFVKKEDRVYMSSFSKETTKYVWLEVGIKNKLEDLWHFELTFNFFNSARQLKGRTTIVNDVKESEGTVITYASGWGNNTEGATFQQDAYFAEIVFMGQIIATVPLIFGKENVPGDIEYISGAVLGSANALKAGINNDETVEDVLAELDELIGLSNIKEQIREHIDYIEFIKLRKEKGYEDSENIKLHSIFTGNPGTGKTTVVNMLGRLYRAMGLLSKGHVLEVGRADLVGEFIGQTAPLVKKKIKEAKGGILFIDEAYALYRKDSEKDYGHEVIEVLLKEMSEGSGDIAIMGAGYPAEMDDFLNSNPGLKSRINYTFHFNDYLPEELMQIIDFYAGKKELTLAEEAKVGLDKIITERYRNRDKTFGNARMAISMVNEAKMNMARRLMANPDVRELPEEDLSRIEYIDVQEIIKDANHKELHLEVDEGLLKICMQDLDELVGLVNIKTEISEMIKLVRYYNETGRDVLNKFSLHTVFTGNPGTGKTTIARIMGKIYKALGILERGHVLEVDRSELVAGYVGQTAIKTQDVIDKAMGGVLFIDEAYALTDGGGENDFGKESIDIILKEMEDKRGQFSVIVAGYPRPMTKFLESNPGLKSRFDRTLNFKDYTIEEMMDICKLMFSKESLTMDKEAEAFISNYISSLMQTKDEFYGNAREIRKVTEKIVRNQHLRMAGMESAQRTPEMIATITIEDLKSMEIPAGRAYNPIGFQRTSS
ncbi:MAG: AAA family ATPase [Bacteroidales bacterium]|nr:AAA family ATPase [Bacteroidales bacterium]